MQTIYAVMGGELKKIGGPIEFRDPERLDFVGTFADHEDAKAAWKARAQATVDNAHMRYVILPLHDLIRVAA